jgi:hypothetical protein
MPHDYLWASSLGCQQGSQWASRRRQSVSQQQKAPVETSIAAAQLANEAVISLACFVDKMHQ